MKWQEVRKLYPNKFVKIKILEAHVEGSYKIVDEMAVIQSFEDNKQATKELVRSKDDVVVYHTANKKIMIELRNIKGYRGIIS
ncbi:hypothetical protein [Dethiothermospora halolimnae]|uniref:hypothetical protein n=1 Tax=Dethiothermospora halolimnae TaxID=3114390 RepID=UPI003CCBBC71